MLAVVEAVVCDPAIKKVRHSSMIALGSSLNKSSVSRMESRSVSSKLDWFSPRYLFSIISNILAWRTYIFVLVSLLIPVIFKNQVLA